MADDEPHVGQLALICANIPGRQTVPRAELFGFDLAQRHGSRAIRRHATDASYLVRGYAAQSTEQQKAWTEGSNGDMWDLVFPHQDHLGQGLEKIKAHMSASAVREGVVDFQSWLLHTLADIAAEGGVGKCTRIVSSGTSR